MQKIFIRNTVVIITSAIFLILFINVLFTWKELEEQQFESFHVKIEQVIHTLENNRAELALMRESLDEDYLTRAKAAAYVLDRQEEVSMDVSEMQYLASLLNVDEVHIIDENGVIVVSSVSKYVGIDMAKHKQTSEFLALLDSDDEDAYLIQDMQPNAAEDKIMQYVGVARKVKKGIVQVGFEPKRQIEAQARNTYEYIFSRFPTDVEEELFVVNCNGGAILGHSDNVDMDFSQECYQLDSLYACTKGAYKEGTDKRKMYVVSQKFEDVLICAALPGEVLKQKLLANTFHTLFYLLLIEAAVILLLNYLVKRKVINGIHQINKSLSDITNGNFDMTVSVGGNREFEELSKGINTMVSSIINISGRISAIIEISGIPLAAFEYEKGINHVFVTSGLGELLDLSNEKVSEFCRDTKLFDKCIREITRMPVEGEEDVYRIHDAKFVRIHMSESVEGKLGVITDVTGDVIEKSRMRYENTHDPLTGLYKYQHFKQLAGEKLQEIESGEICAAVMMDLDFFKGINDTYGHDAGDRYLQGFASVLNNMPAEHFLTARRSGDEFCMMIFGCKDQKEVVGYLEYFYQKLGENEIDLSDTDTRTISVSAGFACTDNKDADILELISNADDALYEVKEDTKGTYGPQIVSAGNAHAGHLGK